MKKTVLTKVIALLLLLTLCSVVFCGCCGHRGENEGRDFPELVIGSDYYSPFVFKDDNGELAGLDIELAKEVCRHMGINPKFVRIDWEKKNDYLSSGEIDCIWGCFSLTGREQDYAWSLPYMNSRQVIATLEDSDIFEISDLQGKSVAVQATSKPDEIFSGRSGVCMTVPELKALNTFPDISHVMTAITEGYVDAIAGHEEVFIEYMKTCTARFKILKEPLLEVRVGVAFAKGTHAEIIERLNETFRLIQNNGYLNGLFLSYGLDPQTHLVDYDKEK